MPSEGNKGLDEDLKLQAGFIGHSSIGLGFFVLNLSHSQCSLERQDCNSRLSLHVCKEGQPL